MANYFDKIVGVEHVVAESSRLKATTAGHIYDLEMIADTDNGSIVAVGAHVEGQLFKAEAYAAGKKPYLVLTPPLAYNGRRGQTDEKYFYNAKGDVARAYELYVGDIYTVSDTAGANYAGQIIEEVDYTNSVSYRIRVIKL